MIEVQTIDWDDETGSMTVVANNNSGRGEWYIEIHGYYGFDEEGHSTQLACYKYELHRFDGREKSFIDENDDPYALLDHVPTQWRSLMTEHIEDFIANDLPRLLDGTMEWDEIADASVMEG